MLKGTLKPKSSFYKGDNHFDFRFAFLHPKPLLKKIAYSKRKEFAPQENKFSTSLTTQSRNKNKMATLSFGKTVFEYGAATSENVPSDMCVQRRFRSACAFAQSDLNLRWAHSGYSSLGAFWIDKGTKDNNHSDMRRLICDFLIYHYHVADSGGSIGCSSIW